MTEARRLRNSFLTFLKFFTSIHCVFDLCLLKFSLNTKVIGGIFYTPFILVKTRLRIKKTTYEVKYENSLFAIRLDNICHWKHSKTDESNLHFQYNSLLDRSTIFYTDAIIEMHMEFPQEPK